MAGGANLPTSPINGSPSISDQMEALLLSQQLELLILILVATADDVQTPKQFCRLTTRSGFWQIYAIPILDGH